MRKILVLVASVLMLIAFPANGHICGDTQCVSCSKDNPEYRRHGHHYHPKYFIGKNGVYFGNMPVEGASKSGFKVLSDGYAMDSWNVYYCGRKLEYVAVNSFKVLGCGYAKDNWNVYFDGVRIDGASAGSFKYMGDGYGEDNWNTYYMGRKLE